MKHLFIAVLLIVSTSFLSCGGDIQTDEDENVLSDLSALQDATPPAGTSLQFCYNFYADDDWGQCNGGATGVQCVPLDRWSPALRILSGTLDIIAKALALLIHTKAASGVPLNVGPSGTDPYVEQSENTVFGVKASGMDNGFI